jgi:glycosyltransferase involved in cell wall biosynthesis
VDSDAWNKASRWEAEWWGDCSNTADEEAKQVFYADQMGVPRWGSHLVGAVFDAGGKSILDIGGGPVSLLLRCKNRGRSLVVDPIRWPDWIHERYRTAGITYLQMYAEDLDLIERFDEVWIYNVLQHVQDPALVIHRARAHGKVVRVFEWIDAEVNVGHPHSLSQAFLSKHLGVPGRVIQSPWGAATAERAWVGVTGAPRHRFHLLGLAHTQTTTEFVMCAYTQKVLKLARMLTDLGYDVIHYGAEGSEVPCDHMTVITKATQRECYGDYDWHREFFRHDPKDLAYTTFNANTIAAINERKQPGDFLLCSFGNYQKAIADAVQIAFTCELGIGYSGVFTRYRVFESYAWMHYVYGLLREDGGSWYDAVIPNYFDPKDFLFSETKGDYFLYAGRLVHRKGVLIAAQVAERLKVPLVVVGQGSLDGLGLRPGPFLEHRGSVGIADRATLMAGARAVFVPTDYIEPFGGVSIEANFCGTPVITTDWGCFSENVIHGVTGFRCRTFADFLFAAQNAGSLDPRVIQWFAVENFSMARVSAMYAHYFDQVADIDGKGWYAEHDESDRLDWLRRSYPPSC